MYANIGPLPLWAQERLFEERLQMERRRQDAIDAIDFLQSGGVVNTPELFWYDGCGETLLERIKRAQGEKIFRWHDEAQR